jgi:hypothetical protein
MACSCKSGSSNRQVTALKQVVKKPFKETSRPSKKINRRVIFKRS